MAFETRVNSRPVSSNSSMTRSTSSFVRSAPVDLTSVNGYSDFISRLDGKEYTTVLKSDYSEGYVMRDGEVIANIYGDAKDYLVRIADCN